MKIAFDKIDVTPADPCYMAGYNRQKPSESVLDSIQVNSLSFNIRNESFILTVLDSIMLEPSFCTEVKARVSKETGVDPGRITVACIHTHSAPAYFKLAFEDTHVEPELTAQALDAMVKSSTRAFQSMQPCTYTFEKMQVEGLYGNRNIKGGVEDKNCYLISFVDKAGKPLGAFFNLSVHPTILNGSSFALSADLIGQIRLRLESHLSCPVLCTNGTCGDVSTRFYRTASGIEELMTTAQALYNQVIEKKRAVALDPGTIACGHIERPTVFDARTDSDWANMTAHVKQMLEEGADPMAPFFQKRQQLKLEMSPIHLNLISQYFIFGGLIIVTLPGDICSELGRRIKDAFPDYEVIIVGYANTYCNYLVPDCDYGKYFETFNSRTARGESDAFVAEVIGSIEALLAE